MAADDEQSPSEDPDYRVYRSRRGPLSRLRSADLSKLRERARRGSDKDKGAGSVAADPESGDRSLGKRIGKWVAIAVGVWIALSIAAFAISSQFQKMKLADSASEELGGNAFLLGSAQNILVIGTDARPSDTEEPGVETRDNCLERGSNGEPPGSNCAGFRADTLMIVRAGGGKFRKLSIPRDVFAEIPGQDPQKINGAYAFGGAGLQIKAVEGFLGIDINHVVIVDFTGFEDFIDAIGGVEVDVERKFCSEISGGAGGGQGGFTLRLGKGEHTLDGEDALIFARTRKNDCDPAYDDLDRAAAQQQVLNGIKGRMTSPLRLPYNFIKGPIIGWTAPKAFVSDMGALAMPQLVLSTLIASSGDTDVLCGTENLGGCGSGPGGSIEVPEAERRRAVSKLID